MDFSANVHVPMGGSTYYVVMMEAFDIRCWYKELKCMTLSQVISSW